MHDESAVTPIVSLLREQVSLEGAVRENDVLISIRTHDEHVVPISVLKADPDADASVILGG